MAGTTPYTFTALELLTAAKMNAIQANMQVVLDGINEPLVLSIQLNDDVALSTGDDVVEFHIPSKMNGWTITGATATRKSGTGTLTLDLYNVTDGVDVFSTPLTIDTGETNSATAATPVVINTSNDDVATGDIFRVDVTDSGTNTLHGTINIEFTRP